MKLGLSQLLYPPAYTCAVCDRETGLGLAWCPDCLGRLPFIVPPICEVCGRLLRLTAAANGSCRECGSEKLFFSRARAVCLYEGPVRAYLHEVKFHRSLTLAKALAGLLARFAREDRSHRRYDTIVPVPLHRQRLEERGFNQAAVMADAVAKALGRPVASGAVVRTRRTESQSRLDRNRRRENVRGAFQVRDPAAIAGRRVLLIDDILTTGYTASECARVMLRAGAVDVGILTVANGCLEADWLEGSVKKS